MNYLKNSKKNVMSKVDEEFQTKSENYLKATGVYIFRR